MTYADPGASYYEERYRQRVLHNLQRRAQQLGFTLVADPARRWMEFLRKATAFFAKENP